MEASESTSAEEMEGEVSSSTSQAISHSEEIAFDIIEQSFVENEEVVLDDLPDTSAAADVWEAVEDDGLVAHTEAQQSGVSDCNDDSEPFAVSALADINTVSSESFDTLSEEVIAMPSIGDNNELDFLRENILISTTSEEIVEFGSPSNIIVQQSVELSTSDSVDNEEVVECSIDDYPHPQSSSFNVIEFGPSNSQPSTSHDITIYTSNPDSTTFESSSRQNQPTSSNAEVSTTDEETSQVSTSYANPASNNPTTSESTHESSQNVDEVSSINVQTSPNVSQTRSVCTSSTSAGKEPVRRLNLGNNPQSSGGPSQSEQPSPQNSSIPLESRPAVPKTDPVSSTKDADSNPSTSNSTSASQESQIGTSSSIPKVTAKQLSEAIDNLAPCSSSMLTTEGQSILSSESADSEDSSSGSNSTSTASSNVKTLVTKARNTEQSISLPSSSGSSTSVEKSPNDRSPVVPAASGSSVSPVTPLVVVKTSPGTRVKLVRQRLTMPAGSESSPIPAKPIEGHVQKAVPVEESDGKKEAITDAAAGEPAASTRGKSPPKPAANLSALDAIKAAYAMQAATNSDSDDSSSESKVPKETKTTAKSPIKELPKSVEKTDSKPLKPTEVSSTSVVKPVQVSQDTTLASGNTPTAKPTENLSTEVLKSSKSGDSVDGPVQQVKIVGDDRNVAGPSQASSRTEIDAAHPRFTKSPTRRVVQEEAPEVPSPPPPSEPPKEKKASFAKSLADKIGKLISKVVSPKSETKVTPFSFSTQPASSSGEDAAATVSHPVLPKTPDPPKVEKLTLKLQKDTTLYASTSAAIQSTDAKQSSSNAGQETLVSSGTFEEPKVEKLTLKLNKDPKVETLTSEAGRTPETNQPKITLKLKKDPTTSQTAVIESSMDVDQDGKQSEVVSSSAREEPKVGKLTLKLKKDSIISPQEKITLKLKKNLVISEASTSESVPEAEVLSKPVKPAEEEKKVEKLTLKLKTTDIAGKSTEPAYTKKEEKHDKITLTLKKDPVTSELLVSDKSSPMEVVVPETEAKHEKLMLKLRKDPITSEITNLQDKSTTDSNKQVELEEKHEKITLKLKKDPITSELVSEKVSEQISSKQQSSSKNIDGSEVVAPEPKVAKLTLKLKKDHEGLPHSPDRKVSTPEALISPRTATDSYKPEEKVEKITLTLKKDATTSEIIAEKKLSKKEPLKIDISEANDESYSHKEEPKLVEKLTLKLKPGEQSAEVVMGSPKEVTKLDKITLRLTKDMNTSEIIAEKLPKKHFDEALCVKVSDHEETSAKPSPKEPSKLDKITIKLSKDDTGEIVQTESPVEEPKLVEKLTLKLKPSSVSPVGMVETTSEKSSSAKSPKDLAAKLDKITLRLSKDTTMRAEIVDTGKDSSNPGSPSVLQEQEKIKLTFKKDAAWSVQKTKIKSKDSENSQSSQDECSIEITEVPRKFESNDNATESTEKFHEAASVTKSDDGASTSKPQKSLKRTLDKMENSPKPPKLSAKNFAEISVAVQDPPQPIKTPEQQLRVMLSKIGTTTTTIGSDLSITLSSPVKVSPRLKSPREPKPVAPNDDVEIIQVAGPSSAADDKPVAVVEAPPIPPVDPAVVEPKPKKPRGRPRKQALVAIPTTAASHAIPGQVATPVAASATSTPAVEPKREILRPKRSCRGDPTPPVVKEKKPRKPRVVKKKRGGWRGTGGKKVTTPKGKAKAERMPPPMPDVVQNFEEETQMSAPEEEEAEEEEVEEPPPPPTPPPVVVAPPVVVVPPPELVNDESQGSVVSTSTNATTTPSLKKEKAGRMEIELSVNKEVTVEQIAEYQWPPDKTGEHFMIQEQISEYLKVKSFKRKYPDLTRRPVEMEERTFLTERGLVTESMCDLGLTAVSSAEVLDIMYSDFQEKYEEYRRYLREKQAKEFTTRQKAVQASSNATTERKLDFKEKAVQSAADWNSSFNRTRKDKRRCVFDLQSFTIHFPQAKRQRMTVKPQANIGHYPVSLIPGQYTDFYKSYTPAELRYFPLNTVIYGPLKPNERQQPGTSGCSDGSQSDSDDSSSSDDSSDSSSEGTQDTEDTGSLAGDLDPPDEKAKPEAEVKEELVREGAVCKVCSKDKNKEGADEVLIHCAQCTTSVHPSCLDLTLDMVPHIRRYDWQCTDCKTCILCKDPADEDKMLFCDMCDRGYHIYCVGLRRVPTGRWHCKECAVCGSCGALEPGGTSDTGSAMWQHEYKKGEKGARVYAQTLCIPCSKLWRKGRYCQLCWRCYGFRPEDEEGLISCSVCERWMHSECCNTVGGAELDRGTTNFVCDLCQEKSHPRPATKLVRHSGKV